MHPCPTLTVLAAGQVAELPLSLCGSASVLGFTSLPRVFANASGRIEFIIFLIMDWSFASGCSPPRLSTTQLPSATDSQCSVRRGLSPRCWCALSGARGGTQSLRMKGFCFSPVLSPPSFSSSSSSSLSVFDRCWLEAGYGRDSDRSFFARSKMGWRSEKGSSYRRHF
jgi:hypothetical protein